MRIWVKGELKAKDENKVQGREIKLPCAANEDRGGRAVMIQRQLYRVTEGFLGLCTELNFFSYKFGINSTTYWSVLMLSRYIYHLIPLALMSSEIYFRVINKKSAFSMKSYWKNRLYQIVSLTPFMLIGFYITRDSSNADEVLLSNMFSALILFAFLIVSIIQESYNQSD